MRISSVLSGAALFTALNALCPQFTSTAKAAAAPVRSPKGIYVIFWPASEMNPGPLTAPPDCSYSGTPNPADENITNNACALIANPAASGLLVGVGWSFLDPPSGFTGTLTSGSPCLTSLSSTLGLMPGMSIADATTATNIPLGTTIFEVPATATCQIRMSAKAMGSGTTTMCSTRPPATTSTTN